MTNGEQAIRKATKQHVAALMYGEIGDLIWQGSGRYIKAQGTITFIRYRNRCFGVTNEHVYPGKASRTSVWHIALKEHQPLRARPLFTSTRTNADYPFDIALFELDEEVISRGGKIPIELAEDAVLEEGDLLLAVGFPGAERKIFEEQTLHGLYHVGATAIGFSDRTIQLYEELSDSKSQTWNFGGMSGGPIFKVKPNSYSLAGIIFDAAETPPPNTIHIEGFPFGPAQLELAFQVFGLNPSQ
jgi:Trypsin-like peptidase domain